MIPIRLELRNFMSYGENVMPLDFTGMHLACLCGDNGHGKSALLDAITWALWGEARASADELIRLGADEMRVVFDFQLGEDLYRVIRARSKRASGNIWEIYVAEGRKSSVISDQSSVGDTGPANLQSAICNLKSASWKPLTGQGIRDTGRVIQRILRMDYKTFVNSAYIRQGRADEFTKQTVGDRKQILADILDLSRYDALEQKAKDRRNEAEQILQDLEREIAHIEAELAGESSHEENLSKSRAEREALEGETAKSEKRFRELQARHTELQSLANRIAETERSVQGWRSEIAGLNARRVEQERRVETSREVLKDRDRILAGVERLRKARESLAALDRRLQELRKLEHEKAGLEQQILAEKHKLDLERGSLAKELSELQGRIDGASRLEKDVASLRSQVKQLDELDARRAKLQEIATSESDRLTELKGQHERALQVKEDLEGKLGMLSEAARCPLCQTDLDHEKHEHILNDYKFEIERADVEVRNLRRRGQEVKSKRDSARREIERIEQGSKAGLEIRRQLAEKEQLLSQIEGYRKQLPEVKSRLDEAASKLESDDFAKDLRAKTAAIADGIAKLGYDADAHERVREEIAASEQFESLAVSLKHAEKSLPADEANLKAISDLIAAREKSIADSELSVRELSESAKDLPSTASEMKSIGESLQVLRASDREITGRIATLENALARCKSLRAEVSGKTKDLEKAKVDRAMYAELVAAFGKKGVQALIIENAVPEIQEEANRLLARMTDNAMQIAIETVRDKKTGGTAETLDIRISDDMGTRSYELFSGGEAFRINFALRIALSKLLARRAGARLQTLVIDEGFGTQDGKGREKLVEAINSIRDDFEKILVITHIDELKDAFPTRIEITKDASGSQISVN